MWPLRPSLLYAALFATLGRRLSDGPRHFTLDRYFLAVPEFVALYIGVRLSRSMTASVAEIYRAARE